MRVNSRWIEFLCIWIYSLCRKVCQEREETREEKHRGLKRIIKGEAKRRKKHFPPSLPLLLSFLFSFPLGRKIRWATERMGAANVVTKGQGNNFDSLTNSFVIPPLPRAVERTDCTRDRLSTLHHARFPNNPQNYQTIRVIALLHQLSADAARN